jgi:hypothetical protein
MEATVVFVTGLAIGPVSAASPDSPRAATTTKRAVFETTDEATLSELIKDSTEYALKSVDKNGFAISKPDPALLEFIRQRARTPNNPPSSPETTAAK